MCETLLLPLRHPLFLNTTPSLHLELHSSPYVPYNLWRSMSTFAFRGTLLEMSVKHLKRHEKHRPIKRGSLYPFTNILPPDMQFDWDICSQFPRNSIILCYDRLPDLRYHHSIAFPSVNLLAAGSKPKQYSRSSVQIPAVPLCTSVKNSSNILRPRIKRRQCLGKCCQGC